MVTSGYQTKFDLQQAPPLKYILKHQKRVTTIFSGILNTNTPPECCLFKSAIDPVLKWIYLLI